jgi:hypothetical protein
LRILLEEPIYNSLIASAEKRGSTAPKLARLLLVTVLTDNLVDAVLDHRPARSAELRWQEALSLCEPRKA